MFHHIPKEIENRMLELEAMDLADRGDGTPRMSRLRQVTKDTGRLLALLLASAPAGAALEIGTSAGYSALWMSLACRETGRKLHTFELLEEKIAKARETFRVAGVTGWIELVEGDALANLKDFEEVAFCFCDTEKELYSRVYDLVLERMKPGGLFLADNCNSHRAELEAFLEKAESDPRVDAMVLPVGTGVLLARKL